MKKRTIALVFVASLALHATPAFAAEAWGFFNPGPAAPDQPWVNNFGAIAIGTRADGTLVGYAMYNEGNMTAADEDAVSRCQQVRGVNCRLISHWGPGGCGYISVSRNDRPGQRQAWGTADNAQKAYDMCISKLPRGQDCRDPVGGCNN